MFREEGRIFESRLAGGLAGTEVAMARHMKNDTPDMKPTRAKAAGDASRVSRPRAPRKAVPSSTPVVAGPSAADVARRAYEIYLLRNGAPGNPESDWLQAEAELRAQALRK